MSERAEKLKAIWDELTPEERDELFAYFQSHAGEDEELTPEEWQDAWVEEANRRAADVAAGRSKLIPVEDVMQRLKEKHG